MSHWKTEYLSKIKGLRSTSIIPYSKKLKLAEKGYNPDHEYENQVTVIMAFSLNSRIPVAVDVDLSPLILDRYSVFQ